MQTFRLFLFIIIAFQLSCGSSSDSGSSGGGGSSDPTPSSTTFLKQLGDVTSVPGGDTSNSDQCNDVAVDSSGNTYCAGTTSGSVGEANGGGSDAIVIKYNTEGVLQWITQLGATTTATGGSNAGNDICNGVAVDSSGNVYCAGTTSGALGETNGGSNDAFVLKLDSSGALLWLTQLGGVTAVPGGNTSSSDICNDVAVDSSGNVYCAGETNSSLGEAAGGSSDAFVLQLDSAGSLQWIRQLGSVTTVPGGNTGSADACNGVDVDSSGNVYCAGDTLGAIGEANGGNVDIFLMQLNSSGVVQWITQLGGTTKASGGSNLFIDTCEDVSVDSSANVYCAGSTAGPLAEANGGSRDVVVLKLNSSGTLQWVTQLGGVTAVPGGSTAGIDQCFGVSSDDSGNVYCSGSTTGALGETSGGNNDLFTLKLNSSGALQWLTQFGNTTKGPGGVTLGNDACNSSEVDSVGNVYCAGYSNEALGETAAGSLDMVVLKLSSTGSL